MWEAEADEHLRQQAGSGFDNATGDHGGVDVSEASNVQKDQVERIRESREVVSRLALVEMTRVSGCWTDVSDANLRKAASAQRYQMETGCANWRVVPRR